MGKKNILKGDLGGEDMTLEQLIDKLEKELQEDEQEKREWGHLEQVGHTEGWMQATRRIIALLKEVKE